MGCDTTFAHGLGMFTLSGGEGCNLEGFKMKWNEILVMFMVALDAFVEYTDSRRSPNFLVEF